MSVNQVILLGNVGAEPKTSRLDNSTCVTKFSMATTEKWKDKNGEKHEVVTWHNIELWRGIAEVAEKYLHKGDKVYIQGKIKNSSYDDKDGKKVYTTSVVGELMELLGQKQGSSTTESSTPINTPDPKYTPPANTSFEDEKGDDLPF